jgi:hypothetical protein
MNPKEIEKTANIWSMIADPINLIEGPAGLGISAAQALSDR